MNAMPADVVRHLTRAVLQEAADAYPTESPDTPLAVLDSGSTLAVLPANGDEIRLLPMPHTGQRTDTGSRPAASHGDPP